MATHISHTVLIPPKFPSVTALPELGEQITEANAVLEDEIVHAKRLRRSCNRLLSATDKLSRQLASDDKAAINIEAIASEIHEASADARRSGSALAERREAHGDQMALSPSEQELFDKVKEMLGNLDSSYLAYYQEAITKFTEYFDAIRKALNLIQTHAGDNDNEIIFQRNGVENELEKIINSDEWVVGSFDSEDEARKLGESLTPAFEMVEKNGKWELRVDTTQASELKNNMPWEGKMSTVFFNTWTNKRESAVASLNTAAQATAEAFSRANSTYDNLVKLLSSLIESMIKMMEGFLPT